ncbi:serine/threonine protein kinase [Lujinxingia sediminis]|uniref:Serine/threonine protein kinase n=1 Tax=Lujinxingia sediminis TaxID=2480984 RepID=A0ABY0CT47_9DELT|nr:serine/threonine-protein kinase [Lujinxingia sediminis]RVU44771.1 serine/threonine protein kinase [Lujinxingia sediminis]
MSAGASIGTVIENKYRLDEQIGHGGMGAVYRGTQLMVDRPVAVKLLHPNFAHQKNVQARFEVEARAIGRLNHPNCITLYDFGYSADLNAFYTVVEYIDGVALDEIVQQRMPLSTVVTILRQIASALDHAHHHGILHRDLKPENIMLARQTDGSEAVKVLDFGIAQIMTGETEDDDDFEADRLTRAGELFGTPPYMSPEQAQSSRTLTPATDLYSMGIIAYELIENRLPFFTDNPLDILMMHIQHDPPPMRRAAVPDALRAVVMKLLAKDPAARPPNGKAVIEQLATIPADALDVPLAAATGPSDGADTSRAVDPTLLNLDTGESRAPGVSDTSLDIDLALPPTRPPSAPLTSPHPPRSEGAPAIPTLMGSPEDKPWRSPSAERIAQSNSRRSLVVMLGALFILMFAGLLWWVSSQGAAEPSEAPAPPPGDIAETAPEASPPASHQTTELSAEEPVPREVSVESVDGLEPSIDAVAPTPELDHYPPPPPPTRPATQRRQADLKPSRTRPTRSAEAGESSANDAPVRLYDDQTDDDAPRRPARLGL